MTLLTDILNRVARQVSVNAPSSWLGATDDEYLEIRDDFLLETVEDVLDRYDLPAPISTTTTVTGTGVETYALPANFLRLQRGGFAVYEAGQNRPLQPVTDDGMWQHLQQIGATGVTRYFRLSGYKGAYEIDLYPFPSTDITVHYVTDLWVVNAGNFASTFTNPTDESLIPRRIVESGIVWRWRERKGLPFADKRTEYEILLSRLSNDSRTRRAVSMGKVEPVRWQDLVPAFIPGS